MLISVAIDNRTSPVVVFSGGRAAAGGVTFYWSSSRAGTAEP